MKKQLYQVRIFYPEKDLSQRLLCKHITIYFGTYMKLMYIFEDNYTIGPISLVQTNKCSTFFKKSS